MSCIVNHDNLKFCVYLNVACPSMSHSVQVTFLPLSLIVAYQ